MSNVPSNYSHGQPPPPPIDLPDTSGNLPGNDNRYTPPIEPLKIEHSIFCGDRLVKNLHHSNEHKSLKDDARRWDAGTIIGVVCLCIAFLPAGVAVIIMHALRVRKRKRERIIHCDGCMEYLNDNIDRYERGYLRLDFHNDRPCKENYLRRELTDIIEGKPQLVAAPYQKQITCDGCSLIIRNNYYHVAKSNVQIDYCSLKCHNTHHRPIMERVLAGNLNVPTTGDMSRPMEGNVEGYKQ